MDIVLEKSKLSAPMFDGAGFMVRTHRDNSWATSFGGDADVPVDSQTSNTLKFFYVTGTGYEPVPKVI